MFLAYFRDNNQDIITVIMSVFIYCHLPVLMMACWDLSSPPGYQLADQAGQDFGNVIRYLFNIRSDNVMP